MYRLSTCLHATHVGSVDHKQKASRPPPCGGDTSVTTGAEAVAVGGKHLTTELAPHESFARLAYEHRPIMTLWLGSMGTVLISSDKVARDMFKNHDVVLARRKTYEAIKGGFGTDGSIIMAQYGPEWRTLRRLCTTEFFVTSQLDATQGVFQIAIQLRRKVCIYRIETNKNVQKVNCMLHIQNEGTEDLLKWKQPLFEESKQNCTPSGIAKIVRTLYGHQRRFHIYCTNRHARPTTSPMRKIRQ